MHFRKDLRSCAFSNTWMHKRNGVAGSEKDNYGDGQEYQLYAAITFNLAIRMFSSNQTVKSLLTLSTVELVPTNNKLVRSTYIGILWSITISVQ